MVDLPTIIRPSWDDIFLTMVVSLTRRSTCRRLHVGCVITSIDHRRVLAIGYNGGAAGLENDCESLEPGLCGHLHAEENACIKCADEGPKVVYCSHLPCVMCCKRLINLGGVQRLVFKETYRNAEGLSLLTRAGIKWDHQPRVEADDLFDNLTATQARCTALLEEVRQLKEKAI